MTVEGTPEDVTSQPGECETSVSGEDDDARDWVMESLISELIERYVVATPVSILALYNVMHT